MSVKENSFFLDSYCSFYFSVTVICMIWVIFWHYIPLPHSLNYLLSFSAFLFSCSRRWELTFLKYTCLIKSDSQSKTPFLQNWLYFFLKAVNVTETLKLTRRITRATKPGSGVSVKELLLFYCHTCFFLL